LLAGFSTPKEVTVKLLKLYRQETTTHINDQDFPKEITAGKYITGIISDVKKKKITEFVARAEFTPELTVGKRYRLVIDRRGISLELKNKVVKYGA
jgi:hypothetical protein